jgi:hypothetical protein
MNSNHGYPRFCARIVTESSAKRHSHGSTRNTVTGILGSRLCSRLISENLFMTDEMLVRVL